MSHNVHLTTYLTGVGLVNVTLSCPNTSRKRVVKGMSSDKATLVLAGRRKDSYTLKMY